MEDEQFQKRISGTVINIFPLDRMIPVETLYSFFVQEYKRTNNKSLFLKDRKYQRLREGYFALFAALSLNDMTGKQHHLLFPSDDSNDVYIFYFKDGGRAETEGYSFDIKEYTNFSNSFADFVNKSISSKIDIYNLIVATYRKMNENDLKLLINCLQDKDATIKVWLLGAPAEEQNNNQISKITVVNKNGIIYEKNIDLNEWLEKNKPPIVYQDVVRFR